MTGDHVHEWVECQSGGEFEAYGWPCGQCVTCGEFGPLENVRPRFVTAADISRLAGVTRAAVWNWAKRFDTFPNEAGRTSRGPVYRTAEVLKWLETDRPGRWVITHAIVNGVIVEIEGKR